MVPSDCGSAPAIEDIGLTIPSNLVVVPGIKSGGIEASAGFGLVDFVVGRWVKAVAHAPFPIGVRRRLQGLHFCPPQLMRFGKFLDFSKQ